ncbi:hypothetical protein B0H14DRAFT_2990567 [Mycena olivaceomarginata]|nr:hypothetical protein B0H14DRAFT_2990567 [Mycena olivaceomarginata]
MDLDSEHEEVVRRREQRARERVPRKSGQSERSMERDESDGYGPLSGAEDEDSLTSNAIAHLHPVPNQRHEARDGGSGTLISTPSEGPPLLRARFTHSSTCSPVGVTPAPAPASSPAPTLAPARAKPPLPNTLPSPAPVGLPPCAYARTAT